GRRATPRLLSLLLLAQESLSFEGIEAAICLALHLSRLAGDVDSTAKRGMPLAGAVALLLNQPLARARGLLRERRAGDGQGADDGCDSQDALKHGELSLCCT